MTVGENLQFPDLQSFLFTRTRTLYLKKVVQVDSTFNIPLPPTITPEEKAVEGGDNRRCQEHCSMPVLSAIRVM